MTDFIDRFASLLDSLEVIDLSQTFEENMSRNSRLVPFMSSKTHSIENDGFYQQTLTLCEHVGTHADAPAHTGSLKKNETIDHVPVNRLLGKASVYHLDRFDPRPGELLSVRHLMELEKTTGVSTSKGDIVLLHYGWDRFWKAGKGWNEYADNCPGLDESAVRYLYEKDVIAVGSDTATCDFAVKNGQIVGKSWGHDELWLPNGILIVECLCNLHLLPSNCFFAALPLKIKEGSGSPLRAVAFIPKNA